ncbi:HAMP domain-containing protein [Salinispira pacifica]|nr:HAMP domain-containing protein [Salinispira pacifica]
MQTPENQEISQLFFRDMENIRQESTGKTVFIAVKETGQMYMNGPSIEYTEAHKYILREDNPADAWFFRTLNDDRNRYELNPDTNREFPSRNIWVNMQVYVDDRIAGVAGTTFPLTRFAGDLSESRIQGHIPVIIDDRSAIVYHPDEKITQANTDQENPEEKILLTDLISFDTSLAARMEILKRSPGETLILNGSGPEGENYVAGLQYIADLGWFFVSMVDIDKVPITMQNTIFRIIVMFIISVLLFYLAIGVLMNRIILHPLRRLESAASRAADGNYSMDFSSSKNDEIGLLGNSFARLLETIRDHTNTLETTINERSNQLKVTQEKLLENRQATAVGKLIISLSHRLNTPLGSALTSADSLSSSIREMKTRLLSNQLSRSEFERLLENAADMNQIVLSNMYRLINIMDVLKSASLDLQQLKESEVDVVELLREVVERVRNSMIPGYPSLHLEQSSPLVIRSFRPALGEVLETILTDILIQDTREDAAISINISLENIPEKREINIQIQDNGTFISDAERREILTPQSISDVNDITREGFRVQLHKANTIIRAVLQGSLEIMNREEGGRLLRIHLPMEIRELTEP